MEIIGDAPTLLILENFWFGARRFDDFVSGTSLIKTVVSDRLQKLVEANCLKKVQYLKRPPRYEYRATQKLLDFYHGSLAMLYWERKWGEQRDKVAIVLRHKSCGEIIDPIPSCGSCKSAIDARDFLWREGPGVGKMLARYGRRRRRSAATQARTNATALLDSITRIIGDRWATLIVRSVFTNLNRFDQILDDTQMATNVLSERLEELCADGVLKKEPYQDRPVRYAYKLTEMGRDIYPILLFLMKWGDKWYAAPEGAPLILTHKPCGATPFDPDITCSACGESISLGDLEFEMNKPRLTDESISEVS